MKKLNFLIVFLFITVFPGCVLDPGRWKTPNLAHPGTLELQRHNMLLTDPLPSATTHGARQDGLRPKDMDHSWNDLSVEMTRQEIFLHQ